MNLFVIFNGDECAVEDTVLIGGGPLLLDELLEPVLVHQHSQPRINGGIGIVDV